MPARQQKVKCPGCSIYFYRDEEPNVNIKNRYWHKKCYDEFVSKQSSSEKSIQELEEYIKTLFGADYVSARIRKQLKDMIDHYHFTYSGILGTLKYWYEIKQNSLEKANNGIGIIPYVYEDAKKYYETIFYASQLNQHVSYFEAEKKQIVISSPKTKNKLNLVFDFDSLEERINIDD